MSRLNVSSPKNAKASTQQLLLDFSRRISANPPGVCPIELQLAFLKVCHAQSCGKCAAMQSLSA